MRRVAICAGITLMSLVMAGAAVLIVERVLTNDSGADVAPFSFRCPTRPPSSDALAARNSNPESDDETVPHGADRLLACRYEDVTEAPGPLVRQRLMRSRKEVSQIAEGLDHLRPYIEEAHSCPSGESEFNVYAIFGYPDEPPVLVEAQPYGCTSADNGRAEGGYPDWGTLQRLAGLVGG